MLGRFQITCCRMLSNNSAMITRPHRAIAARNYPTILVFPNGSTMNIRYHEPRKIIRLPLDLSLLSESERKERIDKRKPKQKVKIQEEIEDSFNSNKYLSHLRKGK